jgi:hypothetical protein
LFSEAFKGPNPASEIETRNMMAFLSRNNDTLKAYITLHCYGQDILYPWGYAKNTYTPDVADLVRSYLHSQNK